MHDVQHASWNRMRRDNGQRHPISQNDCILPPTTTQERHFSSDGLCSDHRIGLHTHEGHNHTFSTSMCTPTPQSDPILDGIDRVGQTKQNLYHPTGHVETWSPISPARTHITPSSTSPFSSTPSSSSSSSSYPFPSTNTPKDTNSSLRHSIPQSDLGGEAVDVFETIDSSVCGTTHCIDGTAHQDIDPENKFEGGTVLSDARSGSVGGIQSSHNNSSDSTRSLCVNTYPRKLSTANSLISNITAAPFSNTLAVIKTHSYGALRRSRNKKPMTSQGLDAGFEDEEHEQTKCVQHPAGDVQIGSRKRRRIDEEYDAS
jgi:hypothetical protein